MRVYKDYKEFSGLNPVVTVGMFDGVHRGHLYLLQKVIERAGEMVGESVAITLEPHPRLVLSENPDELSFLTSLEDKAHLIEEAGIEHLIVLPFTRELRQLEACDFIQQLLVGGVGIKHLILGFDHQFGYQGEGNHGTIGDCALKYGFKVERLQALKNEDLIISSTTIRSHLEKGDLKRANELLGYNYFLSGEVVHGKMIGRKLGYPTANLRPYYKHKLVPADGVYAADILLGHDRYKGMIYIGPRPTIDRGGKQRSVEVNIFDFEGDIYGERLRVFFRHRTRGDIQFESKEMLRRQIDRDKEECMRLLAD